MKVTVVGAGNVGATAANVIASAGYASEVVLLDIKEGVSEGKAMDMMQTSQILNFDTTITGVTNDYAATAGSKVVVITSGIPRKPGMSREDLIGVNAGIVGSVIEQAVKYSPDAIFIVISNPMDAMTYLALKNSGLPKNHVIGMGGMLDSSRFRYFLSQALKKKGIPATPTDIDGMVIGGHSDKTMVPLGSIATYKGIPVSHFLDEAELEDAIAQTKVGGATLTKLLGTSAWYAPGAAAGELVKSIITDGKKLILRQACARSYIDSLYYKVSFGNGTGLIHNNCLDAIEFFYGNAPLEKNPFLGSCSDSREKGQGNAQHQGTGTADNQEGQSRIDGRSS